MIEALNTGVLFILGASVFGGILGAYLFQRLKIPQVMGYVAIGITFGVSGIRLVDKADLINLQPLNLFALGLIGFLVGGELKVSVFKKYSKQFTAILLCEGVGAFLLVGTGSTLLLYMVCGNFPIALATGVVFGAIASATDPASTIDVLWENRSKGVLTASITAIVALDDALAMTLYGLGTGVAEILTSEKSSLLHELTHIALELGGALFLGIICGYLLLFLLKWLNQKEKNIVLTLGLLLLVISISNSLKFDVILATMTAGFVLTNTAPRYSEVLFGTIREFSSPIYVLFFVMVGARLEVAAMPLWLWGIIAIYVFGRALGKIVGAYTGATITSASPEVKNYLGLGILPQGGVAVGLSIVAGSQLHGIMITNTLNAGDTIIFAITATTLIAQLTGPPLTKLAVKLAGEANKDIKEEDLIEELTVEDVTILGQTSVAAHATVNEALKQFASGDHSTLSVTSKDGQLCGTVSLSGIKELITDPQSWDWVLVADVMEPVLDIISLNEPLKNCLSNMLHLNLETVPVVISKDNKQPVGIISRSYTYKQISERLIQSQLST